MTYFDANGFHKNLLPLWEFFMRMLTTSFTLSVNSFVGNYYTSSTKQEAQIAWFSNNIRKSVGFKPENLLYVIGKVTWVLALITLLLIAVPWKLLGVSIKIAIWAIVAVPWILLIVAYNIKFVATSQNEH